MSEDTGRTGEEPPRGLLRRTLDLCVFAPVGLAVTVAEDLPELIAKGHRRVGLELGNARVVGRFVVHKGQRRVSGRLEDLLRSGTEEPESGEHDEPVERVAAEVEEPAPDHEPSAAPKPVRDPAAAAVVSGALADYDTLSASQVVRRLDSLGSDELEAVVRYEASHRNRRTILNRATQLLDPEHRPHGTPTAEAPAPFGVEAEPGTAAE